MKAKAACTPIKWDEHPYGELSPPTRMTKASVDYKYQGELEGVGHTEYVMFYVNYNETNPHASTASYVGMTRFTGTLRGKSGSFVMEERGTFKGGRATSEVVIIKKSGTGQLQGIAGNGHGRATQTGAELELTYELA